MVVRIVVVVAFNRTNQPLHYPADFLALSLIEELGLTQKGHVAVFLNDTPLV